MCLKSNGTVHAARTTFIAKEKSLLSMMSQCVMVSKTKFQHSVTTTFFFARFSVKAVSLWPFCENLIKLWIFSFFFYGAKDERRTTNQPEISRPSWKNSNWRPKVASRSLWWWHNAKNSSFWVAQEVQRGKRGDGRWSQEWEAIHQQNRWKCWACETKNAERSPSYS